MLGGTAVVSDEAVLRPHPTQEASGAPSPPSFGSEALPLSTQFFFFAAKSFMVSIWFKTWKRLQGVKSLPSGYREGLLAGALTWGVGGSSSKAAGLQRLLIMLEGESLEDLWDQPACRGWSGGPHLLGSVPPGSHRGGGL